MSNDWLVQTGLVLFVENYDACVAFYRNVLELPLIKDQGDIIILGFGNGYLMIEPGGTARAQKSRVDNPAILRFNVADVDAVAGKLRALGVAVDVQANPWASRACSTIPTAIPASCGTISTALSPRRPEPQPSPISGRL